MKNININLIDARKIKATIWEKIDDSKVKLDIDLLEREFGKDE
jgi:hypothetical protein